MALTPSSKDENRKAELKRKKENPNSFNQYDADPRVEEPKPKDWNPSSGLRGSSVVEEPEDPKPTVEIKVEQFSDDPVVVNLARIIDEELQNDPEMTDESMWTGSNKIRVDVLEERTGEEVTSEQRDEAEEVFAAWKRALNDIDE